MVYCQFIILPQKVKTLFVRFLFVIPALASFSILPIIYLPVDGKIITTLNIILFLQQTLFESVRLIDRRRYIISNNELIQFHLDQCTDIHLKKDLYSSREKPEDNLKHETYELFEAGNKNMAEYTKLVNRNHFILSKVFFILYNTFSEWYLQRICVLSEGRSVKVPEPIAIKLRNALDEKFDIQKNTSIYLPKDFHEINKEDTEIPNNNNISERGFIINPILLVEQLKSDLENSENNNCCDLPSGLGYYFEKDTKIPYFLWICEWHKMRNEKIWFVSLLEGNQIIKNLSSKFNDIKSDFSINERVVAANHKQHFWNYNRSKSNKEQKECIILTNNVNAKESIRINLFPDKMVFFEITMIKANGIKSKYHETYKQLFNSRIKDISKQLEGLFFPDKNDKNGIRKKIMDYVPLAQ